MASTDSPTTHHEHTQSNDKPWLNSYPEGVPEFIDYPNINLFDYLQQAYENYPDNTAMIFFDKKTSYKEFYNSVLRLATGLHKLGVKKGDRVAIYLPNIPQFMISFFAIQRLGASVVPFNPQYKEHELKHQLNDAGIEVVICLDYAMYQRLNQVREETNVKHVIVARVSNEMSFSKVLLGRLFFKIPFSRKISDGDIKFDKFLLENVEIDLPDLDIDPHNDLALVQYTGGTTGVSKGAMLTHRNLISNTLVLRYWIKPEPVMGGERYLMVIPLFHVYGLSVGMLSAVSLASTVILTPDAKAGRPMFQDLLETMIKHKPTIFHGVPTLYLGLLYHPKIKDYDLTSIKACISGSAPLPVEIMKNFEELTGANVVEGYGLTETSPITHCNPIALDGMKKPGTIGLPLPDTMAKIFDPDDKEKELPLGEEGELGIKGPQVMKGYWKRQEATEKVMNSQGFFLTGDIAVIDEDGYFTITDRKKDMINASGMKIYPRELEEVLFEHPAVAEAAVVGVPHKIRGETAKAFVVLKDGETASDRELIEFCKSRLAKYKVPRYIEFLHELPKTAVGKTMRRALRDIEYEKARKKGIIK